MILFHPPELRPFGDDVPNPNHDSRVRENSEVAIIYADLIYVRKDRRGTGWWYTYPSET